jgi:hypothetical protein
MATPGSALRQHLRHWNLTHRDFRVLEPWDRRAFRGTMSQLSYWGGPCTGEAYSPGQVLALPRSPALSGDVRATEPTLTGAGALIMRRGQPMVTLSLSDSGGGEFAETIREALRKTAWKTLWLYPTEGGYDLFLFETLLPMTGRLHFSRAPSAWQALARVLPERLRGRDAERMDHAAMLKCEASIAPPSGNQVTALGGSQITGPPAIVDPWGAIVDARAFGHEGIDQPRVMVRYAIFIPRIHHVPTGASTVRLRIEGYRLGDGSRISMDTTRIFTFPPSLFEFGFLTGTATLPVGAGEWLFAVRLSPADGSEESGSYAVRRGLEISDGPGLDMSDILAGHPSLPSVHTALGAFPLNFLAEWPEDTELSLAYQVLGLDAGTEFSVAWEVIRAEKWPKPSTQGEIARTSTGLVSEIRELLPLKGLKPGNYWLALTARSGEEAVSRYLEFKVTGR